MSGFKSVFAKVPKHSRFHYEARYAKEEKGLEHRKKILKIEKGSFYKHSKTLSKFRDPSIAHYNHNTNARKNAKYMVSILMMACVFVFFNIGSKFNIAGFILSINAVAGIVSLFLLLILLVVFLRLNNKA